MQSCIGKYVVSKLVWLSSFPDWFAKVLWFHPLAGEHAIPKLSVTQIDDHVDSGAVLFD